VIPVTGDQSHLLVLKVLTEKPLCRSRTWINRTCWY